MLDSQKWPRPFRLSKQNTPSLVLALLAWQAFLECILESREYLECEPPSELSPSILHPYQNAITNRRSLKPYTLHLQWHQYILIQNDDKRIQ